MSILNEIAPVQQFLHCKTPSLWLETALNNIDTLLIDHANCELKAASTAMSMIYRHPQHQFIAEKMSPLAREELLHYEKVCKIMKTRDINYHVLSPARYAKCLLTQVSPQQEKKLVDQLIIGAIIEARSCERFAALIPLLDDELASFYSSLVKSEARHFEDYLMLAKQLADCDISHRIEQLLEHEQELIESCDNEFRFHSGIPTIS